MAPVATASKVTLSTEAILKYARLKARIERLTARKEAMAEEVKELMTLEDVEEYGPRESPFKFRCQTSDRSDVKWKEIAGKFARKLFGKKAGEELEAEAALYPKKKVTSLYCEFNERYRVKAREER